ncbi:MAG: TRAP transporter substrate-binding protein DctP [Pseudomonadota bacterium]
MTLAKRRAILGAIASSPLWLQNMAMADTTTLKISHQFPGGTVNEGDFRDRMTRMFAAKVEERTKGALKFTIYPGSSLMKTNSQFAAMRKGALDLSLVPLSYAGNELPEVNIGLMPGLVTSYEQGYSWKNAEIGKELTRLLYDKGVIIVSWIWQAGGVASRNVPIVSPEDAKGMKIRGGSREMDMMLKAAGAAVISLPSNEIYAAMQTGAMDAALTSSTSLISFRLEEVSKALTTGRGQAYWFMFEPLMISRTVFEKLSKEHQSAIMAIGEEIETFGRMAAQLDDAVVANIYKRAGAKVVDLSPHVVRKWQALARTTAWKDYAEHSESCAKLLKLAEKTL